MGIEPTSVAWEATALPLSYARIVRAVYALGRGLRKKAACCGPERTDEPGTTQQRTPEMQKGFSPDGSGSEAPGLKPLPQQASTAFGLPHHRLPYPARHAAGQGG